MFEQNEQQLPQTKHNDLAFSLSVFAHPEHWILARGYPPPLRDSRAWVRGMRGTALVGLLGCLTGVQIVVGFSVIGNVPGSWFAGAMMGCLFGLIVLVPIARWSGWGVSSLVFVACSTLIHLPFAKWVSSPDAETALIHRFWMCFSMAMIVQLIRPAECRGDRIVSVVFSLACTSLGLCIVQDDFGIVSHLRVLNPRGGFSEVFELWLGFFIVIQMEIMFALSFCGPFWLNGPVDVPQSRPAPEFSAPQP